MSYPKSFEDLSQSKEDEEKTNNHVGSFILSMVTEEDSGSKGQHWNPREMEISMGFLSNFRRMSFHVTFVVWWDLVVRRKKEHEIKQTSFLNCLPLPLWKHQ